MTGTGRESFLLEFPPQPHYVSTARLFAAAVARSFTADEDSVEDVKLAVSEACTSAIRARRDGMAEGGVRLSARHESGRLSFEAEDAGVRIGPHGAEPVLPSSGSTSDEIARRLGLETIRALFPDTEIVTNERGGGNIRFSLEVGEAAGPPPGPAA